MSPDIRLAQFESAKLACVVRLGIRVWCHLQVETLHAYFHKDEHMAVETVVWDKAMKEGLQLNLQLCSATLTELYLEPLRLDPWLSELKVCGSSALKH